jgi:Transposase, Mutator family
MAEGPRMTAAQLADKLLASQHADVLGESVAWMVAELMEAEVAAQVGAELGERTPERVAQRNGYRADPGTPGLVSWSCASPGCGPAATSRRFWSRAGGPSRPWSRSSRRPRSMGGRPGGWTGWSSSSASPACPRTRCPGCAAGWTPRWGVAGAAAGGPLPVPVAGRQGGTGPRARRGPPQGAGDRRRRACQRPP